MLGPAYGLGLRDCALVILFFTLVTTIPPAYLSTWGPKTGMRQMIQGRFSFGCALFLLCRSRPVANSGHPGDTSSPSPWCSTS